MELRSYEGKLPGYEISDECCLCSLTSYRCYDLTGGQVSTDKLWYDVYIAILRSLETSRSYVSKVAEHSEAPGVIGKVGS
jgi:hypothetical protein